MKLVYHPRFLKQYALLEKEYRAIVKEKMMLLLDIRNHKALKVHKLHGKMKNQNAFSVDYHTRVVFEYLDKKTIAFLDIGIHDIYK